MTATGSTPDSPHQPRRVQRLLKEYVALRRRYGVLEQHPRLLRLEKATDRRSFRVKHLREQIEELAGELRWLESEMESFDKGRELLLVELIDELRTRFGETWSPLPVLGYRYWFVREGAFLGFRQRWSEPTLEARCLTTLCDQEVPHTDGRCGPPPCGIYAIKDVGRVLEPIVQERVAEDGVAVGLVGLSGKVVEHRLGYRAARAEVLALAVRQSGRELLCAHDRARMRELFGDPDATTRWLATAGEPQTLISISLLRFLTDQERNHSWTSVNKSA